MIVNIPPHQQASIDRAWAKRHAAKAAVDAAKAAYRASSGKIDTPESQALYRAWKAAEAVERKRRGVCLRLDYLFRYKPEIDGEPAPVNGKAYRVKCVSDQTIEVVADSVEDAIHRAMCGEGNLVDTDTHDFDVTRLRKKA